MINTAATNCIVLALFSGHSADNIFSGGELLLHLEERAAFIERHND
jgi:hypothetical protein